MNTIDIAVIVIVGVAFIAVMGYLIYRKVKGKGGCCDCGCSCSLCNACPHCNTRENKEEK